MHHADIFGTHFMYRAQIGRLDTNFGGEMLRAEGGEPQKLGTNSLKFQLTPNGSPYPAPGFFDSWQIWDPFYLYSANRQIGSQLWRQGAQGGGG